MRSRNAALSTPAESDGPVVASLRSSIDTGVLPLLSTLLRAPDHAASHGNAALCIAECATEPRCLAVRVSAAQSHPSAINMWPLPQVLAVQPVVPPLLDLAHRGEGQTMKNAAIALGRLASNERCLHAIRENHGIEILARAMKGDVAKTMGTRK